jgi:hypothetical protein
MYVMPMDPRRGYCMAEQQASSIHRTYVERLHIIDLDLTVIKMNSLQS